jgi:AcrR family transcriptional regulator
MVAVRSATDLRQALTGGLAAAVTEKGYAASTIADVVAHARVSKRTFYQHFADKEACLMALYEQGCEHLIGVLGGASADGPWRDVVSDSVTAYLTALENMPAVSRTLLVEIQAAGPSAYRLRQQMQRRFADTIVGLTGRNPEVPPLAPDLAIALVGGINELLLQASDPYTGGGTSFTSLTGTIERLVFAVLSASSGGMSTPGGELTMR